MRLLAHLVPFARALAKATEEQSLDVVRRHDVDAGRKAGDDLALCCRAVLKKVMQEVVVADGERETLDLRTQLFGNIAGVGVAEVAAGEREAYRLALGFGVGFGVSRHLLRCVEIDGALDGNANPVERVDRRDLSARLDRLRLRRLLNQTEAVVVATLDGDVADVRCLDASHLLALQGGDSILRMQQEQPHAAHMPQRLDGGRARIAGGCADHDQQPFPLRRKGFEKLSVELQRDVLEGERRSVKKFEQPKVALHLAHRHDGAAAKSFKGFVRNRRKIQLRQATASGKNPHHRSHNLGKGRVGGKEAAKPSGARPAGRLVKTAVGSKTAAENIRKGFLLASARRSVVHVIHAVNSS